MIYICLPLKKFISYCMKRITTLFILFFTTISLFAQEGKVTGSLVDSETQAPVTGANIELNGQTTISDDDGFYTLDHVHYGKDTIKIKCKGYFAFFSPVEITAPKTDLQVYKIKSDPSQMTENAGISEVNASVLDFEDNNKDQNISGLLHASSDVFCNVASYTFSSAYYRMRGYDAENMIINISNIEMNDPETGRPNWSEWSGLNDDLRNKEVISGLGASHYAFGSIGGVTNFITRASQQRKQQKLTYSLSNRSYANRIMYTYSTGLMKNNWALTITGSHRWGNESYVKGVFYDAWSYFLSAEKKLNDKNSFALTILGSPTKRGMQAPATQECYDLLGTHYYNPNWGFQNGEVRNARIKEFHEPIAVINDFWDVNDKLKVTTSLAYSFGKNSNSALNWYNAADPRPDYYRYLPSYQFADTTVTPDPLLVETITNAWTNNPMVHQINWERMYQVNYLANSQDAPANYIVEKRNDDHKQVVFNSLVTYQHNDNITLSGGLNLDKYTGYHYKTIKDLLGGNYWLDIDQYAITDFPDNPDAMQNDLNNPNRKVTEGETFGYNYNIFVNTWNVWAQAEYKENRLEVYGATYFTGTRFWREGLYRNGRDPENSYGESEKSTYVNYGVKSGFTYKFSGHNYLVGNTAYLTRAPYVKNVFVSPDTKNTLVPDTKSVSIFSGDLSYIYKSPYLSLRVTGYHTIFNNESRVITYYHDDYKTFVNMTLTGIDKVSQGFELGAEYKVSASVKVFAASSLGNYVYTSEPEAVISLENQAQPDKVETIYQKYFYVGGTPQQASSVGVKYVHPKQWFFNFNINYYDKIYLDFNPQRRTQEAIYMLGEGNPLISEITREQKLDGGYTVDASLGKSLRFRKYFVNFNFSVNNIFNNQDLIISGYEQMRFDYDQKNLDKFPPKYFYGIGRNFFINVSVRI